MEIYQIDAFTKKPFCGNSAGVTFGDNLNDEIKQKIAKEMNLAETAFLSKSDKADYKLQWFTPAVEVELCGHATIASLHFLKEHSLLKNGQTITFDTRSGILKCKMEDDKYFMQIPLYKMENYNGERANIFSALGITEANLAENTPMLLLKNTNLYICLKSLNDLKNVSPNFKDLVKTVTSLRAKVKNFGDGLEMAVAKLKKLRDESKNEQTAQYDGIIPLDHGLIRQETQTVQSKNLFDQQ